MKHKDYVRLSKISLKSRKKTTKSTVRGISFGLILLMPLLFIVMAFHVDLNKQVNKDASLRVFNIAFVNQTSEDSYAQYMLDSNSDEVYSIDGVSNIVKYNMYTFTNRDFTFDEEKGESIYIPRFSVILDGNTFSLDKDVEIQTEYGSDEGKVNIQVIDTSVGNNIFLKSDTEIIGNKSPLVAGDVFNNENSSKEIMVSSNFLANYGLNEDIIGKKITLNYILNYGGEVTTSKTSFSGNFDSYSGMPVNIFKDYTIVGIYDSNIYKSSLRKDSSSNRYGDAKVHETYFWLTTDSVYNSLNKSYIPEPISIEEETSNGDVYSRNAFYYQTDLMDMAKSSLTDNTVFIPLGMGASLINQGNQYPIYYSFVEFESYSDANNAVSIVNNLYKATSTSQDDVSVTTSYMNNTFLNYRMFYNIFTYVTIVLAVFGGIIFFATLLNLYNTIHYSVQSRRNYLGLSRAIGMKNHEVTKLYFVEVFQIFKRSYIWTAIFGGGICAGICFLFKMIMESDVAAIITIDLSLNPIFILIAFIILILANTLISIIFSLIACHNVANKPILEVLVENR